MNDEIEVIESTPTKLKYKDVVWIPETIDTETNNLSSEKIRCWIRFKGIQQFTLDDLRVAFPEWNRYAKSQLIFKLNPLTKNKFIQQLHTGEFKVVNNG